MYYMESSDEKNTISRSFAKIFGALLSIFQRISKLFFPLPLQNVSKVQTNIFCINFEVFAPFYDFFCNSNANFYTKDVESIKFKWPYMFFVLKKGLFFFVRNSKPQNVTQKTNLSFCCKIFVLMNLDSFIWHNIAYKLTSAEQSSIFLYLDSRMSLMNLMLSAQ